MLPVLERSAAGLLRDMRWPAAAMGWPGPGKVAPPGGAPGNLPPSIGCPEPSLQHPCQLSSSISSGHSIDIKMCDLWYPPGEGVRGDEGRPVELQHGVLRRGRGEGEHSLGGPARSDREEESSNTVPVLYCTVLYCTVLLYCLALRI